MSLPLSFLICLSVSQLCLGAPPVLDIIKIRKVNRYGGWNEKSPEAKDVQQATQHAVEVLNKNSKGKELYKLVTINRAQSAVNNKINFKINAILRRTKCPEMENLDLTKCILDEKQLKCQFHVILDPRKNTFELYDQECK